jgi:nucleoside-diphosphate-sugar epimerase/acyl carrier protein
MIPSYFITIKQLPINSNGKLDKNKLPSVVSLLEDQQRKSIKARDSVEEDLILLWQELLHVDNIGIFDNFFSLGGHSLLMTKVVAYVKTKLDINLPLRSFFEEPTIANLSAIIKQDNITSEPKINKNLSTDSILDPAIQPIGQFNYANSPKVILLTGATGFLGAYLLLELCKKTEAIIYCIIRAGSISEAQEKINKSCQKYNLNYKVHSNRISIILGDLSKPNLGLTPVDYINLSEEVDTIYHNGALVNHIFDYNKLRETNVLCTIEIIKLATNLKTKNIHYISTLSNCSLDDNNNISEGFPSYKPHNLLHGGYAISKWISEILLGQAVARGIPVTIYRPSNITGETKTGIVALQNNHLLSLIKGCAQIKYAPDWDMQLDLNPVDFVSQLIIKISLSETSSNKVFNIINDHKIKWKKLISWLQNKGYEINLQPQKKWRDSLITLVDTENALYPLLSIYLYPTEDSAANKNIEILCNNTNSFMEEHRIVWPLINDYILENYFNYLAKVGFL